ncbi:hypothetical protein D9757_012539 [Collybiopsis confluens]|uniref:Uncharacterized protein n=1 Tax=Collybiopsis confluens TaxID=2823264 RepID=A0A8H5G1T8_9AGAR|nr:hypothetical protein D9757_012539 [Collybiopsis confluens]
MAPSDFAVVVEYLKLTDIVSGELGKVLISSQDLVGIDSQVTLQNEGLDYAWKEADTTSEVILLTVSASIHTAGESQKGFTLRSAADGVISGFQLTFTEGTFQSDLQIEVSLFPQENHFFIVRRCCGSDGEGTGIVVVSWLDGTEFGADDGGGSDGSGVLCVQVVVQAVKAVLEVLVALSLEEALPALAVLGSEDAEGSPGSGNFGSPGKPGGGSEGSTETRIGQGVNTALAAIVPPAVGFVVLGIFRRRLFSSNNVGNDKSLWLLPPKLDFSLLSANDPPQGCLRSGPAWQA